MTTEGTATLSDAAADAGDRLFCYRHPDRETWIRCGRCDRPICTRCAMQGPVGFRCRQCGTLANDPLTTIRPGQALVALGVSSLLAAGVGLVSTQIGFFGILLSFFAGGFIAEAVVRVIGYKRGRTIFILIIGGILLGSVAGALGGALFTLAQLTSVPLPDGVEFPVGPFLLGMLPYALIGAAAASFGAYTRLR